MNWSSTEVVSDWLNYIDSVIIIEKGDSELWHNTKNLVLDSIETLDYIRKATDNIPAFEDNRFQKLIDVCMQNCRNDYYQRFLEYKGSYYHERKDLWWIDCWQSIRLNNILHEMDILTIDTFFDSSDGKHFRDKWENFFSFARSEMFGVSSLPAFSYLECVRFLVNMGRDIPYDELSKFLTKLYERNSNSLNLFSNSNEIRGQALYIIKQINERWPERFDLNYIETNLSKTLAKLLTESKWDQYSHSWSPTLLKISKKEIVDIIKSKIPIDGTINPIWINGTNFTRKPRYAFLLLFATLNGVKKFYELIEPNRFAYAPPNYVSNYIYVGRIVDQALQSFKDVKDLQKKIQDNEITEGYFRDLLKFGIATALANNENIKWAEKERPTGSGRITDISLTVQKGPEIPIETKLLWRFNSGYEPIEEVLEQLNIGTLGLTFVINPPDNPRYKSKYQDFDGWINFVKDHPTYIPGSIRSSNNLFEAKVEFKSKHFFSDHNHALGERKRNITLLNFFVDLRDYTRSPNLSKL